MFRTILRVLPPVLCLFLLLFTPQASMQGVRSGLTLWANAVVPALLPFYAATQLLQQCGVLSLLAPLLRPVCRLVRLPASFGGLLLAAWLSGAPNGVRLAADVTDDPSVCTRFCACATVTGPLFLIGTAGQLLGSPLLGAMIYGIHVFTALCNGLLWRSYGKNAAASCFVPEKPPVSILTALPEALRSCALSMLFIGASIAFFSAFTAALNALGLTAALESILRFAMPTEAAAPLLAAFFEVSQGTLLAARAALSLPLRLSLLCAFASFGGLSVLCQAMVFLRGRILCGVYFLQRVTHALLSFLCCRALCLLPIGALPVMAAASSPAASSAAPPWSAVLTLCTLLCLTAQLNATKGR